MPNRMLRESLLVSEQVSGLGWFEEVCFTRMILCADDFGRLDGRCVLLAARMFPLRRDVEADAVAAAVDALEAAGLVARYEVDGHPYLQLPGWERNQKLHYRRARCPAPEGHEYGAGLAGEVNNQARGLGGPEAGRMTAEDGAQAGVQGGPYAHGDAGAPARAGTALEAEAEEKEKRDTQTARAVFFAREPEFGAGPAAFVPPAADEVRRYVEEHGYEVDPVRFVDFYNSKGWMVGTSPMRSWRAAVNIWQGNLKAEQAAAARIAARESHALRIVPGGGQAVGASACVNPFAVAEDVAQGKDAIGLDGGIGNGCTIAGRYVQKGRRPEQARP